MAKQINQHKQMAMGMSCAPGYAKGGGVMPAIKGQPMNPVTKAKRNNGVPGYKAGGKVKAKC